MGLKAYLLKRLVYTIVLVFFVLTLNFIIFEALPGGNGAINNILGSGHRVSQVQIDYLYHLWARPALVREILQVHRQHANAPIWHFTTERSSSPSRPTTEASGHARTARRFDAFGHRDRNRARNGKRLQEGRRPRLLVGRGVSNNLFSPNLLDGSTLHSSLRPIFPVVPDRRKRPPRMGNQRASVESSSGPPD